ncbi:hypothetical protein ACS5NO_26160 [Larkinella sp. GY13]
MRKISKARSREDIPSYDKMYWWSKTPEERLQAALKLIQHAKEIYRSNPANPPLANGNRIHKSNTPIERGKR